MKKKLLLIITTSLIVAGLILIGVGVLNNGLEQITIPYIH